jgi:hypothetical protein
MALSTIVEFVASSILLGRSQNPKDPASQCFAFGEVNAGER